MRKVKITRPLDDVLPGHAGKIRGFAQERKSPLSQALVAIVLHHDPTRWKEYEDFVNGRLNWAHADQSVFDAMIRKTETHVGALKLKGAKPWHKGAYEEIKRHSIHDLVSMAESAEAGERRSQKLRKLLENTKLALQLEDFAGEHDVIPETVLTALVLSREGHREGDYKKSFLKKTTGAEYGEVSYENHSERLEKLQGALEKRPDFAERLYKAVKGKKLW